MRTLSVPFLVSSLVLLATPLLAQRGRSRPEAILERVGCWFVDAKVEGGTEAVPGNPFGGIKSLQEAAAARQPAVLYLFDPKSDEKKFQQYEQTMFNSDDLGMAMRPFRCLRLDVTTQTEFMAKYGSRVPVWVGFDENGKQVGEVAQTGNKAAINPLTDMLERAAGGYVKPSLEVFIEKYRGVVHDLEMLEGKRRALATRRDNLGDKDTVKRAELDKDGKALDAEEKDLLAKEKTLLEQARVQPRDPGAKRVGARDRRGGR